MFQVDRERFEGMVAQAIEELPPLFLDRLDNLEFAIEDYARPEDYAHLDHTHGSTLLGVYRGVPMTRRRGGYQMVLPDGIVIFQQPIQRLARDEADLAERVRRVVRHEIAHYFGISDERLREIDAY